MESGQRLLGALEFAGAILITSGLAVRAAVQQIYNKQKYENFSLNGYRVLIIGNDKLLQNELAKQFSSKGCHVARAGPKGVNDDVQGNFYVCNTSDQLKDVAKEIDIKFGELDIVVYASKETQSTSSEPIDRIACIVQNDLMEHYHVISQFMPKLARRSGCFITVEPQRTSSGVFSSTEKSITLLSDTLTQQLGGNVRIIHAHRRTKRHTDREDVGESAAAILNAIETGQNSITLPAVKQHVKNIFRYLFAELRQLWKNKF